MRPKNKRPQATDSKSKDKPQPKQNYRVDEGSHIEKKELFPNTLIKAKFGDGS